MSEPSIPFRTRHGHSPDTPESASREADAFRTPIYSQPPEFVPLSWACNAHVQTIVPFLWTPRERYAAKPVEFQLPDGDAIVLHYDSPVGASTCKRIVLMLHGLCGNHASGYVVRIARAVRDVGWHTVRMDMRGCGAGAHRAKHIFHADRTIDLLHTVNYLSRQHRHARLSLCGFSLGGNLVLKLLGQFAKELPENVDSAIVVEPPIDLGVCARSLQRMPNAFYDRYFATVMYSDFRNRRRFVQGADRIQLERTPRSIIEFDSAITAPLAGFESADHYYECASASGALPNIRIPVALLTAVDDPIVPISVFDGLRLRPNVQMFVTERGGHLGFFSAANDFAPKRRWMDRSIIQWIADADLMANRAAAA